MISFSKFFSGRLMSQKIWLACIFVLVFSVFGFSLQSFAAPINSRNPIELKISAVTKDGQKVDTRTENQDKWVFDGELNLDDAIRYNWKVADLNLKYKDTPANGGGYLKIFAENTNPESLLTEQGTDNYPLKLSTIAAKLKTGQNNLQFVYVNSFTKAEYLPVTFSFNFKNATTTPAIKIVKPDPKAVFMKDVEQEIVLNLKNFKLSNSPSREANIGKLFVYANEISEKNFLGKFIVGKDLPDGTFEVTFTSKELDLAKIGDNNSAKLIFSLTDTSEKVLNYQSELEIITNYNNTLNVGLPRITIVEPKKDRTDQSVENNDKFLLQVENFEILKERPSGNSVNPDPKKGFLQVIITSNDVSQPIQPIWSKTDFTLKELGYASDTEGLKTITVQLVNQNFEKLKPEAKDSIDIIYKPQVQDTKDQSVQVQNNTWRLVFIGLTVVLIVGAISILITRG
jgi:hypothetical protein